jgi:hypothetical protein
MNRTWYGQPVYEHDANDEPTSVLRGFMVACETLCTKGALLRRGVIILLPQIVEAPDTLSRAVAIIDDWLVNNGEAA